MDSARAVITLRCELNVRYGGVHWPVSGTSKDRSGSTAPIARPHDLDNSTGGRCRLVPSIRRSARFNEKNMGLVFSDRSVLYALGHYKYFAWTKPNSAVSQLNSDMPNENQKEIVGIVVLVPNEFALDLHDHEVVAVEATDNSRLPIF